MVCLLLLYNPKGIFGFVQIIRKKTKKPLCVPCMVAAPPPSGGECGWFR